VLPALATMVKQWLLPVHDFHAWVYDTGDFIFPMLAVFLGLSLFYKLAPRRNTTFSEVWAGALFAAVLLRVAKSLFVIYLRDFATLNAVYGTFGGVMALLLWIYLSGCIFILGACVCVARFEMLSTGNDEAGE